MNDDDDDRGERAAAPPTEEPLLSRAWSLFDRSTRLVGTVLGRVDRFVDDLRRDSRSVADESRALWGTATRYAETARASVRATPRFARILSEVVGLLARYRVYQARAEWLTDAQRAERLTALHTRSAERVHDLCVELGGGVLKLGQFLSTRVDLLPTPWVAALSRLQDRVPPEPEEAIRALLTEALGAEPEAVFTTFGIEPVAAASLAQVHRATLADGRTVAVKVQRPGIRALLEIDIAAMEVASRLVGEALPAVDLDAVRRELSRSLAEELDFEREAQALAELGATLAGRADRAVPEALPELSTDKVLTMGFIEGARLGDWLAAADDAGRDRILGILVDEIAREILVDGMFHADPHPGNFLVATPDDGDARLILLDLGSVRRIDAETRRAYAELVGATVARQSAKVAALLHQLGFRAHDGDDDALVRAAEAALATIGGGAADLSQIDPRAEAERLIAVFRDLPRVTVPDHFIAVSRVLGSVSGLLFHYRPALDLFRVVGPHLAAALRPVR